MGELYLIGVIFTLLALVDQQDGSVLDALLAAFIAVFWPLALIGWGIWKIRSKNKNK